MNQLYLSRNLRYLGDQSLLIREKREEKYNFHEVDFHVRNDDYFGTLATILDLMEQEKNSLQNRHIEIIRKLKQNLIYLQKNYQIVKRNNKKISND